MAGIQMWIYVTYNKYISLWILNHTDLLLYYFISYHMTLFLFPIMWPYLIYVTYILKFHATFNLDDMS